VLGRIVNNDRNQESLVLGHVMCSFDGEIPLVTKVTLKPLLGMPGDNRNKEDAVVDLVPDLLVPRVATPQLTLIEPDLDASSP
jgi:hypothetical protein